jgi:hypothetical protein
MCALGATYYPFDPHLYIILVHNIVLSYVSYICSYALLFILAKDKITPSFDRRETVYQPEDKDIPIMLKE